MHYLYKQKMERQIYNGAEPTEEHIVHVVRSVFLCLYESRPSYLGRLAIHTPTSLPVVVALAIA